MQEVSTQDRTEAYGSFFGSTLLYLWGGFAGRGPL
jgi:hypothetical protein